MHGTDSGSGTMIPCTDSGSGAVIPTQNGPSADNKPGATKEPSADEPSATEKPRAIRSRAMMPGTIRGPRAMNSNSDAKRIDSKRDLQIASSSNGQSIDLRNRHALRLGRILRPTFKVQENQLITNIL